MNLKSFTRALNEIRKSEKISRALLIGYYHSDMVRDIDSFKEKYSKNYDVKTIFLSEEDISIIRGNGKNVGKSIKSQELINAITWLKKAKKPGDKFLMSILHHGDEDVEETPEILKGKTVARILSDHGLKGNLNKAEIRYESCFAALNEAPDFFEFLRDKGVTNFLGDAKNTINSTVYSEGQDMYMYPFKKSPEEIFFDSKKKRYKKLLKRTRNDDILDLDHKIIKIRRIEKKLENAIDNYLDAQKKEDKLNRREIPINRGDSLVELNYEGETKGTYKELPRVKDEKGNFKYNDYYICTKGGTLTYTNDPKTIEDFKDMSIRFKDDLDELTEGNDSQKKAKRSSPRMR